VTDGDPNEIPDPAVDAGGGPDAAAAPDVASKIALGDGDRAQIPLFPLRTVLFSGGQLPLKIFETRYTGMVSSCLKQGIGFGVVLLRKGLESRQGPNSETPEFFDVGTEANIVDFNQLNDGVLGIVAQGGRKFRVLRTWAQPDALMMGEVAYLPDEPKAALGEEHAGLVDILQELVQHPMVQKLSLDIDFGDARSVGWRLAELLPIEPEIKQSLLQLHLPKERLSELTRLVNKLRA
jgi:Lon protease-like protein